MLSYIYRVYKYFSDYYYSLLAWNGQQNLFVQWMNRKQTKIICMLYEPEISNGTIVSNQNHSCLKCFCK